MNPWITEQLLRAEIEAHNLMRDEFDNAARRKRRTEGWISGYTLKTKRYQLNNEECINNNKLDNDECVNNPDNTISRAAPNDDDLAMINNDDDHNMCTICLLEVEDGDRIADLCCGHLYHADCLGEWILKKVCFCQTIIL